MPDLLSVLPHGRENATSIKELVFLTELSDRQVRAEIERLVMEERVPVVTLPSASGSVYVATTPEELDAGIGHISAKAGALLRRKRALRQCRVERQIDPALVDRQGNPVLFEVAV